MELLPIAVKFILGFALGAVIGFEREINERKNITTSNPKPSAIVGLRTFSIASLLGVVTGILYTDYIALSILLGTSFLGLLTLFYYLDSKYTGDQGFTTELGLLSTYIIGVLIAIEIIPIQITIALAVVVTIVLSQKDAIKNYIHDVKKTEFNAYLSFAVLALLILPFLPNTSYSLGDIPGLSGFLREINFYPTKLIEINLLNPFGLWMIVVLITGVDLIGYILEKTIGQKKGWLIASAVGGFVSSTATTQSLAQESRNRTTHNSLLSAAVLANMVSFFQISIIIAVFNSIFFLRLLPVIAAMIIAALLIIVYFLSKKEKDKLTYNQNQPKHIIDIKSALKFALLFIIISIISKISLELIGSSGLLTTTAIGALIGLDAVMINTAQLAGNRIDMNLAVNAFLLANAINLIAKSAYAFVNGKKEFATKFLMSMLIIIASSVFISIFPF